MYVQFLNLELHWGSILMTLIPALINLSILGYALSKLDKRRVNNFFELFVLSLCLWQFSEFGFRASLNPYTAEKWYHLSGVFVLFVIVFGNLFVFRFTGLCKTVPQWIISFLVLAPLICFLILIQLGYDEVTIVASPVWHWIGNPVHNFVNSIMSLWMGIGALSMLITLWVFCNRTEKGSVRNKQLFLMAIGLTLPICSGIIVELIFPLILNLDDIPLSAPLVTTFSITTLITINKYNMFSYSPKHHWSDIIETINEGVLIVNTDKNIMYANRAFSNLSNYTFEELIGKNAGILFGKQSISETNEILLKSKSGDSIWVLPNATPYRDHKNNIIGSICFYANIHQMKETKKNLKLSNDELELYVYKASHDLRGPVASMMGLINAWKSENESTSNYLTMLEQTACKLDKTLITMVKAMQVREVGKFLDKINFIEIIDNSLNGFKHYLGFGNLTINTNVSLSGQFISNKFIVETIIQNLIENSIKYQRKDDVIPILNIIVNKITDSNLQIMIHDNGIGIEPEIQSKVFEMYYRGSAGSTGSGLGLYLVKKSVEKLNGKIILQSNPESGTTFSILLPL